MTEYTGAWVPTREPIRVGTAKVGTAILAPGGQITGSMTVETLNGGISVTPFTGTMLATLFSGTVQAASFTGVIQ